MKNGSDVAAFEREFAAYVGAKYAIALCNGTATLHTALVANETLRVVVPPLTMSATTLAALQAGCEVVFGDVDPKTWTLKLDLESCNMPVSLYGLGVPWCGSADIDDAAQTLRKHSRAAFTSYSFQASKILALGEGGMLVTNDEALATRAREFSTLGYRMKADQPRIDPAVIKSSDYERHHWPLAFNYRMNDLTAAEGLIRLSYANSFLDDRSECAAMYRDAIAGCEWLTPQHVPDGWRTDVWAYATAADTKARAVALADAVERHGGERPYACWKITYQEPAFRHLAPDGACPIAENLQPRILAFQTNNLASAGKNALALRLAIAEIGA